MKLSLPTSHGNVIHRLCLVQYCITDSRHELPWLFMAMQGKENNHLKQHIIPGGKWSKAPATLVSYLDT